MKKISYLLVLSAIIAVVLFSACNKKKKDNESRQLSSRKISFTKFGINFTKDLNEKLVKDVMEGKIKAYRYDSLTTTCMFTSDEIKRLSTLEESIRYQPDSSRPDILLDTVLKQVFKASDIVGYSIAEKWNLDPNENEVEGEVYAFAINWQPKIAGIEIPESALFWVDYNDVLKLISKPEAEELKKTIYNTLINKLSDI
jgi:hypothetical protein